MKRTITFFCVFLCFILIFLSGCIYTEKTKVLSGVRAIDRTPVEKDCAELRRFGNLSSLRQQIYADTDEVLDLTGKKNAVQYLPRVNFLSDRIHQNVGDMISMLDPNWTDSKWPLQFNWIVPLNPYDEPDGIRISIEAVYINGKSVPELKKKIQLRFFLDRLTVTLEKSGSSLEICELKKTFGIHLKIVYGTIIKISTHHRLILD